MAPKRNLNLIQKQRQIKTVTCFNNMNMVTSLKYKDIAHI